MRRPAGRQHPRTGGLLAWLRSRHTTCNPLARARLWARPRERARRTGRGSRSVDAAVQNREDLGVSGAVSRMGALAKGCPRTSELREPGVRAPHPARNSGRLATGTSTGVVGPIRLAPCMPEGFSPMYSGRCRAPVLPLNSLPCSSAPPGSGPAHVHRGDLSDVTPSSSPRRRTLRSRDRPVACVDAARTVRRQRAAILVLFHVPPSGHRPQRSSRPSLPSRGRS